MEFSSLLPPAIALLSLPLPRSRARASLAGGVVAALALASLRVAGGLDWRGAGLPASYLSITAALLVLGASLSLGSALPALSGSERTVSRWVIGLGWVVVLGLGLWVALPVAMAGGIIRTFVSLLVLAAVLAALGAAGRALSLPKRLRRLDQSLFGRIKPAPSARWNGADSGLLGLHLALAVVALIAPHLVLLLVAVAGTAITGVLLERRLDSSTRWPWALSAGFLVLALVSGLTIAVAGEVPLALDQLRDGPFSPAFELSAALAWFVAVWPLLRLWPTHARSYGPATTLAGAAILIRVAVPVLSAGTEHWQPLIFPLLVLSMWYAAGLGTWRVALTTAATAGLISLRPSAAWAGVVLLAGEAALSIVGRVGSSHRLTPPVTAAVVLVLMTQAVPLLTGALQAQTFYTVLVATGFAVALLVDEPSDDASTAR